MECCGCDTEKEPQEPAGMYGGGTDLRGPGKTREGWRCCSRWVHLGGGGRGPHKEPAGLYRDGTDLRGSRQTREKAGDVVAGECIWGGGVPH